MTENLFDRYAKPAGRSAPSSSPTRVNPLHLIPYHEAYQGKPLLVTQIDFRKQAQTYSHPRRHAVSYSHIKITLLHPGELPQSWSLRSKDRSLQSICDSGDAAENERLAVAQGDEAFEEKSQGQPFDPVATKPGKKIIFSELFDNLAKLRDKRLWTATDGQLYRDSARFHDVAMVCVLTEKQYWKIRQRVKKRRGKPQRYCVIGYHILNFLGGRVASCAGLSLDAMRAGSVPYPFWWNFLPYPNLMGEDIERRAVKGKSNSSVRYVSSAETRSMGASWQNCFLQKITIDAPSAPAETKLKSAPAPRRFAA